MHGLAGRMSLLFLCSLLFIACAPVTEAPTTPAQAEVSPSENTNVQTISANPSDCLETFDPNTDYFPEKVEAEYSSQWQVSYHNSYKVIDMLLIPDPAGNRETYVLVQCGAPHPAEYAGVDDTYIFEIPIRQLIDGSGGILGAVEMLGLEEYLIAWRGVYRTGIEYLTNVNVRFEAGLIGDIGPYGSSWETTLEFEPDLLIAYEGAEEQESTCALGFLYVHYELSGTASFLMCEKVISSCRTIFLLYTTHRCSPKD
ncbi:MAG: hypothetical protein WDZ49_15780 [Litorilinea sp.]